VNDKPDDVAQMLTDILLHIKSRQIIGHALAIVDLMDSRQAGDTDLWCTLAFLSGATHTACTESSEAKRVDQDLWKAFHALGVGQGKEAAYAKLRKEAEQENILRSAGAKKDPS
jgi:hypothetical protein